MPPGLSPPPPAPPPSHDRRDGGRWTLLQTLKNHAIYLAVRAVLFVLRPLPAPWLASFGRALGLASYLLGASHRRIAAQNLARVFPDLSPRRRRALASRSYGRLGSYLGSTVAQLLRPDRFVPLAFEDGSRQVLDDAVGEGRGVVFASAHLGPWERLAGSLVRHGFPLTTLARESYDPRFMHLYSKLRAGVGVRAVYRGSPSASLQIVRALRRGDLLGAPMDLRSRVPSVDAPFLGLPASSPVGPARIALRTGAAVVVGTVVRSGASPGHPSGRDRGEDLVVRVTRVATADLAADPDREAELTRRLNREISSRIRAFPEGWVWMHPRWEPGRLEDSATSSPETRYTSRRRLDARPGTSFHDRVNDTKA